MPKLFHISHTACVPLRSLKRLAMMYKQTNFESSNTESFFLKEFGKNIFEYLSLSVFNLQLDRSNNRH